MSATDETRAPHLYGNVRPDIMHQAIDLRARALEGIESRTRGVHPLTLDEEATLGALDLAHASVSVGASLEDAQELLCRMWTPGAIAHGMPAPPATSERASATDEEIEMVQQLSVAVEVILNNEGRGALRAVLGELFALRRTLSPPPVDHLDASLALLAMVATAKDSLSPREREALRAALSELTELRRMASRWDAEREAGRPAFEAVAAKLLAPGVPQLSELPILQELQRIADAIAKQGEQLSSLEAAAEELARLLVLVPPVRP